ncbi:hypothetical protein GE061_007756 [Apolygus lucorum]|uniref:Uncharacterized protein n=1 Tax=Apolygus lucorum TaxID=248454 RepID=A0A8S9WPE6_APOLU|nr:hypothetical protein GE061_007756 [Apolygus lucorum]
MTVLEELAFSSGVGAFAERPLNDEGYETIFDAEEIIIEATALLRSLRKSITKHAPKLLNHIEKRVVLLNAHIKKMFHGHPPDYLNMLHQAIITMLHHLQSRIERQ